MRTHLLFLIVLASTDCARDRPTVIEPAPPPITAPPSAPVVLDASPTAPSAAEDAGPPPAALCEGQRHLDTPAAGVSNGLLAGRTRHERAR